MLFNSLDFAIFLPIVFIAYWFLVGKNLRLQNILIFVASYVFYGWWDYRFLSLILFSTTIDYFVGQKLAKEERLSRRKVLLWTSIIVNIGLLGFFKYYNFFLENFIDAFSFFGTKISANSLNIILPVGISFYTFQTLSYTIDIFRKKLKPTKNFFEFAAFVSFFPQLVAGPIERATHLLPQFQRKRVFDYAKAVDGMRQILWGLFKKMVIADNCAKYADLIFSNSDQYSGSTLVIGAIFFTFQIYCDFSGYSDIAIGTSRLFGFDLRKNFNFPYFSRNVAEFWRRWHISLSTWFRDYVYIPLGGSRGNKWSHIRNTFIVFVVSGFWHGANWTFIFWGLINAIYFLPLLLSKRNRNYLGTVATGKVFPSFREMFLMLSTFCLTVLTWIFFRAESLGHAFNYLAEIASPSLLSRPRFHGIRESMTTFIFIIILILMEWKGREHEHALERFLTAHGVWLRRSIYLILVLIIFWFQGNRQGFIYFQF